MSKKSGGKKGRHRSRKAVDASIERILERMEAYRVRNQLVLKRRKRK